MSVIQDLEGGNGNPTLSSLNAIAGVLKIGFLELFEDRPEPGRALVVAAIVDALPALDDRELRMILTRIESLPAKPRSGRSTGD